MSLGPTFAQWRLAAAALILAALASAAAAVSAGGEPGVADPTVEFSETFGPVEDEQALLIPAGVRNVDVVAVGGRGASGEGGIAGGRSAEVSGRVGVTADSVLWILVGGNGGRAISGFTYENLGGFNGGGSSGDQSSFAPATGGGGGGASDVRTRSRFEPESLESRLLVAAGGGGGGATANGGGKAGASGGSAGLNGVRAESAGPGNTIGSGGFGGAAGGSSSGGGGGEGGFSYLGAGTGQPGSDGGDGGLGSGGSGGPGPNNSPPGWGGGGGGGLYGGGGGGGGAMMTSGTPVATGGGGGGGGASLVPPGGSATLAPAGSTPSVRVEYRIPGTTVDGPGGHVDEAQLSFEISSEEADTTFECRLDPEAGGGWEPCGATYTTPLLAEGRHLFEARATNAMGNFDPTPATVEFTVDMVAPTVTIESGPDGPTTETRPAFHFAASEPAARFECAFDGAPFGACSGPRFDQPAGPLAPGAHAFSVRATDLAGNTGAAASRPFSVFVPQHGGSGAAGGDLVLRKPRLSKRRGTAQLPVHAPAAGALVLTGAKVKKASRTAAAAGTVKLPVRARGRALAALRKKGKARVRARVAFHSGTGETIVKRRAIVLRRNLR